MLGKTGVLFTISSGNFELKQGNESRAEYILRILRLSLSPSLSLSLSLSLWAIQIVQFWFLIANWSLFCFLSLLI